MVEFFAFLVWGGACLLVGMILGTAASWQHIMVDKKLTEWRGKLYLISEQSDLGRESDRG
jgi:hypothetical protein